MLLLDSTGIFDVAIRLESWTIVIEKVDLKPGSSKLGKEPLKNLEIVKKKSM
jgi:hypothetical protein